MFGGDGVGSVSCRTPRFADDEPPWRRPVIRELPQVFAARADGQIDRQRARIFADCVGTLLADGARRTAESILPQAA